MNINLLTCAEVESVVGEEGHYQVTVRQEPRYVDRDKCTGCGDCTRACLVHNIIQIPEKPLLPAMSTEEESALTATLTAHHNRKSDLIAMLIEISDQIGYLPRPILVNLPDRLQIPLSEVYRVATFYAQFRFQPPGRHQIMVCQGTACHVRESGLILDALTRNLGIMPGETTADLNFSLDRVACFGACAIAPVVVVGEKVFGAMTTRKTDKLIGKLRGA